MARRAKAFGMTIEYADDYDPPAAALEGLDARKVSLDELFETADVVSLHCPYGPSTHHLVDAARLRSMKHTAYLVNSARGPIVDEDALVAALRAGEIAGAGLDVFENEPAGNPKLLKLANKGKVVVLPHMGSATLEGRIDMGEKVIINIRAFVDGHRPPDRVLPSRV